jgi:hypothetical protein
VFEFVEEALDEIAFAVERVAACALDFTVGLGRNHWGDLSSREGVEQRVGIDERKRPKFDPCRVSVPSCINADEDLE